VTEDLTYAQGQSRMRLAWVGDLDTDWIDIADVVVEAFREAGALTSVFTLEKTVSLDFPCNEILRNYSKGLR